MMHQNCEPIVFCDGWHCDWDCPYLPHNMDERCLYVGNDLDWWDFWIAECVTMKAKENSNGKLD